MIEDSFTQEMADRIVAWIAEGKTLRAFCRKEDTPCFRTVYDWIRKYPEFAEAMEEARRIGFDAIAEEMLEIADTPEAGEIETVDGEGKVVEKRREDMLGHRKLRVYTREQLLAKWHPRKYGTMIKHAGPEGEPLGPSTAVNITTTDPVEAARQYQEMIQRDKPK